MADDIIRVDEYRENGTFVTRAELPGIDPEKDVALTVSDGVLRIEAERRQEEKTEANGSVCQEIRYGSFMRTLPLPVGVSGSDVRATYQDGMPEIRLPVGEPKAPAKIPVEKV